jgi:hypothetical protein
MEKEKYSFSKLESFHNCRRAYYYTYVKGIRGGDNIYSFLGTTCHELTQDIIEGKETNTGAIEKFLSAIDVAEMMGLEWISDKVKSNYTECITHFFENFVPTKGENIKIEDYFEVDIMGVIMRGYIDLYYLKDGELHIIDLKTSSKYSAKDMEHKRRQLIMYACAMESKYPGVEIKLYFNMLKYAKKKKSLIERNKLSFLDDFEDGLVEVEYTEEMKLDLERYVKNTYDNINSRDKDNILEWRMAFNPRVDFFCKNLCSFRSDCLKNT